MLLPRRGAQRTREIHRVEERTKARWYKVVPGRRRVCASPTNARCAGYARALLVMVGVGGMGEVAATPVGWEGLGTTEPRTLGKAKNNVEQCRRKRKMPAGIIVVRPVPPLPQTRLGSRSRRHETQDLHRSTPLGNQWGARAIKVYTGDTPWEYRQAREEGKALGVVKAPNHACTPWSTKEMVYGGNKAKALQIWLQAYNGEGREGREGGSMAWAWGWGSHRQQHMEGYATGRHNGRHGAVLGEGRHMYNSRW